MHHFCAGFYIRENEMPVAEGNMLQHIASCKIDVIPQALYCLAVLGKRPAPKENPMKEKLSSGLFLVILLACLTGCASVSPYESRQNRQDGDLASVVTERLNEDNVTWDYVFHVSSNGRVVSISGAVPNESIRARVIGIALGTPGVDEVVDRLTVQAW